MPYGSEISSSENCSKIIFSLVLKHRCPVQIGSSEVPKMINTIKEQNILISDLICKKVFAFKEKIS